MIQIDHSVLAQGLSDHQAGRLVNAQEAYEYVLKQEPANGQALHWMGLLAYQQRRISEAVSLLARVAALQPDEPHFLNHLGEALRVAGQIPEAMKRFRRALELKPEFPEAMSNLGLACRTGGQLGEAEHWFREAVKLQPAFVDAINNLGMLCHQQGFARRALDCFQHALRLQPASFDIRYNFARALESAGQEAEAYKHFLALAAIRTEVRVFVALGRLARLRGKIEEARAQLRQACECEQSNPHVLMSLAEELQASGLLLEASSVYRRAMAFPVIAADAANNLGIVQRLLNQPEAAAASYRRAIELDGSLYQAITNLAVAEHESENLSEALMLYQRALALNPAYADALNNLGNAWGNAGSAATALRCYTHAILAKPEYLAVHSNRLFALLYSDTFSPEAIAREHSSWGRRLALPEPLVVREVSRPRRRDRPLRIGVLSSDFCRHPVSTFFEPVISDTSQTEVEYFAYADVLTPDEVTARLRLKFHRWTEITHWSDAATAQRIRQDEVDVLVELGGHTARNRLLVCAHRPARVQVSYLGYPATTGLPSIDYRLTDQVVDPPGQTEDFHTEKLIYLPHSAWCFSAPVVSTQPGQPASTGRRLRFGCFNILAKLSPTTRRLWARLLQANPDAELVLKSRHAKHAWVQSLVREDFAPFGVAERIIFISHRAEVADHFRDYLGVDVALDPYPYHGTTTTCEALWMGTPVITLAGRSHVSRVGVSLLRQVGLADCVAGSESEYLSKASELLQNQARRDDLRVALRCQMQASPLMNAANFAADFRQCLLALAER